MTLQEEGPASTGIKARPKSKGDETFPDIYSRPPGFEQARIAAPVSAADLLPAIILDLALRMERTSERRTA